MPFVEGKSIAEATEILQKMGLRVVVERGGKSDKPYDIVVKRDSRQRRWTAAQLRQGGHNQNLKAMPEVRNARCGDAESLVASMGLQVEVGACSATRNWFKVVNQDPGPTAVQQGQHVIIGGQVG